MNWNKKGLIFSVENQNSWMNSHAQCPTALVLEDRIRVYFASRLENQQSLPTFIDVNRENPSEILNLNTEPILDFGRKGTFDENGIIPNYVFQDNGKVYFYYAGWSQCKNVPYKNFTGLAISEDNGLSFTKYSEGPVLGMDKKNPLSATGPGIIKRADDYFMLYSTGMDWVEINGKLEHTYLFSYATSKNLLDWNCSNEILIEPEKEFMAHCKPAIISKNGEHHLWFSTRGSYNFRNSDGEAYRLGYAVSNDLLNWKRNDDAVGISVSDKGWDSEMICYPHIVAVGNKYYMFYNGNGFGRSGFGYAELELN